MRFLYKYEAKSGGGCSQALPLEKGMTIVTTPRLGREFRRDGLREIGRSFWPEKSPETVPETKGAVKMEERELGLRRKEEGLD